MQMKRSSSIWLIALIASVCSDATSNQEKVSTACVAINSKNFYIERPGKYCLTTDLHTRLSFGDRRSESWLIRINARDVVLDLGGHTLGRGRFIVQPGGRAIELGTNAQNVLIKNGKLRNFAAGIFAYGSDFVVSEDRRPLEPLRLEASDADYIFPERNFIFKAMKCEECGRLFEIYPWVGQ